VKALVLAGLLSLVLVATAAAGPRPSVWIAKAAPTSIAGSGFAARSRVTVSYSSAGERTTRRVVTNALGGFLTILPGASFSRCSGAVVTAGKAVLRVLPCASPGGLPRVDGNVSGVVSGNAFVPREVVTITARVSGKDPQDAVATAGPSGGFTIDMHLQTPRCASVFFRARGALGSTATFSTPAPNCRQP
jgi:hypothetical protein